ncbi:OLC1v1021403C1 [Oldenlandia corymbosa var. corymbosa]|uniref:Protein WUSCHEL n=1 Tax=Oldenlandia corymbosa var. corymbosa TaxID=529605 RepID=A0AAV1BW64_OLDCO|nr:OLC1v1021403C1 [Oldenlandia corymbosa var. corymbosa]
MASSNRHWPSMFKSKPCNSHLQWQHDINSSLVSSTGCQRTPTYAPSGCEERSPEPKPRWNPRPEQIRILEAIFNSGMVNPPRDEIRKIRAQLQEYGQVGDANVFYWFQNRKSRSKHKQQRQLQSNLNKTSYLNNNNNNNNNKKTALVSSSSSSSERSSSQNSSADQKTLSLGSIKNAHHHVIMDHASSNSPTASVNQQQPFFQPHQMTDFLSMPFFFPVHHPPPSSPPPPPPPPPAPPVLGPASPSSASLSTPGFCFHDHNLPAAPSDDNNNTSIHPNSTASLLLSDLLLMNHAPNSKKFDDEKVKLHQPVDIYSTVNTAISSATTTQSQTLCFPAALSTIDHIQGIGEAGGVGPAATTHTTKSTVFINDVAFEVTTAHINVREVFGDDAMLLHSTGQPVLTDEWGLTLQPLQHGAFYYLIRTLTSSPHDTPLHDLI